MSQKWLLGLSILVLISACTVPHHPGPTHYLPVADDLQLGMNLPDPSWKLSNKAPNFVSQKMIGHLRQELSAVGRTMNKKRLVKLARQRLSVNEGFVFNGTSDAYLMIDFSPRRQSGTDPDWGDLQGSAYGALLALENEAGIRSLKSDISSVRMGKGIKACRVEARYLLDGQARLFIGIIGYRAPYRFYFYYNDYLRNEQDRRDMELILKSMQFEPISGK